MIYRGITQYKPSKQENRVYWQTITELFDVNGPALELEALYDNTEEAFIDYLIDRGTLIHGYEIGQP